MEKLHPGLFAEWLIARAAAKDGYILCAVGQDPKKLSDWYYDQYSGKQRDKALYWKKHAARVWDCQGLADGYVTERTGVKTNVRARNNYADWCGVRGEGAIPDAYRVPGAAVFIHNGDYISHVGFLVKPVDKTKPAGDWYVVEARGVMYGVVTTKMNSRKWNRWGLMTKYFDYTRTISKDDNPREYGERMLKKGHVGPDVAALQRDLITVGYDCGKYGADGEFGRDTRDAVKRLQTDHELEVDGIAGPETYNMINKILPDMEDEE